MQAGFGCLFFFLLSIIFLLFVAVRNILYVLFSPFRNASRQQPRRDEERPSANGRRTSSAGREAKEASGNRGKIFGKNEGKYVDFEEV